jgi:hypothetical protein
VKSGSPKVSSSASVGRISMLFWKMEASEGAKG